MIDKNNILPTDLLEFAFPTDQNSELKVIGVGGGGCNAVNYMQQTGIDDVMLIVANTDAQALENSPVQTRIQLGQTLTGGRGAGGKPEIGREAAIESIDEVVNLVAGNTDMVFITAGMGGGTGTGAAPVIASKIKKAGILTVAIVTLPFKSEEGKRLEYAKNGIAELEREVDALIVIENEKLISNYAELPLSKAFVEADKVLANAVKSIVEIIKIHGHWNVDFNDVKSVMLDSKVALMGTGRASGENRERLAVERALDSPLLKDNQIKGASDILLNIMSGEEEILVREHQYICNYIQNISGHPDNNFIVGTGRDPALTDDIKVTIIATGFEPGKVFENWEQSEKKNIDSVDQQETAVGNDNNLYEISKSTHDNEARTVQEEEDNTDQPPRIFKRKKKKKSNRGELFHQWTLKLFDDEDEIE